MARFMPGFVLLVFSLFLLYGVPSAAEQDSAGTGTWTDLVKKRLYSFKDATFKVTEDTKVAGIEYSAQAAEHLSVAKVAVTEKASVYWKKAATTVKSYIQGASAFGQAKAGNVVGTVKNVVGGTSEAAVENLQGAKSKATEAYEVKTGETEGQLESAKEHEAGVVGGIIEKLKEITKKEENDEL